MWSKIILDTAHQTIGSRYTKNTTSSIPDTKEVRKANSLKKQAKKALNQAYKHDTNKIQECKLHLQQAKQSLEKEITNSKFETVKQR